MKTTLSLATAATLIAFAATAIPAQAAPPPASEKCFGIAMAGKNDCKAGPGTSCAGSSTVNYSGAAFKKVKAGTCLRLGGTLQAHAGNAAPKPRKA